MTFETSKGNETTNLMIKDDSSIAKKNKTSRERHKSSHSISNTVKKR